MTLRREGPSLHLPVATRTRRALIGAGALAAGALALPGLARQPEPTPNPGHLPPAAASGVHIRPALHSLAPDGPELAALGNGVAAMMDRDSADPTSWLYQANIHGIPAGTRPRAAWATCQHNTWHFLPWHRMYLYFFERILRKASGDPAFALPYWNYAVPAGRDIPLPFRDPPTDSNPLYVAARNPLVNAIDITDEERGFLTRWWNTVPRGIDAAFRQQNYLATGGISFGGAPDTEPERVKGGLELAHDIIHGVVGFDPVTEQRGWMMSVALAARDPLFWLHHANIDRLWKRWLDLGGLRALPVDRPDWADRRFTFFDEDGQEVTLSAVEVIDTAGQLGYRYDDDPAPAPGEPLPEATPGVPDRSPTIVGLEAGPATSFNVAEETVALGPEPATIPLPATGEDVSEGGESTPTAGAFQRNRRILTLRAEGTEATGGAFEIYVNLPPDTPPDPASDYFAGVLSLFGALPDDAASMDQDGHAMPLQCFDISLTIAALEARGEWTGEVEVSLIPIVLAGGAGPEATPAVAVPEGGRPQAPWAILDDIAVTN